MTSTVSNTVAPHSSQQSAPSYASAASAIKLAGAPLIATGTHAPVVGSTSLPQHGKIPMNGRPAITPAVPTVAPTAAVAHGSSNSNNTNGTPTAHTRNSSVTIKAPGGPSNFNPNSGNMAGPKPIMPQFGFASDSPVVAHSTPQPSAAAPIAIPSAHNNRVPSPANSPQPIPMTSGGNAPGGLQPAGPKPVFGSHRNDEGERHMRQNMAQPPMNAQQHPHGRKDSHHSMHEPNMSNQGGRGGFPHQRGNRAYYNAGPGPQPMYAQGSYNGNRGAPAPRGGMNSSPFARHSVPNYNATQSPRMPPGSPAMVNVPPHTSSPSMQPAMPYQHQYHGAPAPYQQMPQAMGQHVQSQNSFKSKKKGRNNYGDKYSQRRQSDHPSYSKASWRPSRRNDRQYETHGTYQHEEAWMQAGDNGGSRYPQNGPPLQYPDATFYQTVDLSPHNPDLQQILTSTQPPYPGFNVQPGYPMQAYSNYQMPPQMGYQHQQQPQQAVNPSFAPTAQPFTPGASQFAPAVVGAQPMSRNNSAISHPDRPNSNGPPPQHPQGNGPIIASGSHPSMIQAKAPVVSGASSSAFKLPKKSAAITIMNESGQALDLSQLKTPTGSSPAAATAPSKTPPVQTSTPTPEPKASNMPAESSAPAKTADERKKEFAEAIKARASTEENEAAEAKAKVEAAEKAEADAKLAAETKAKEDAAALAKVQAEAKAKAETEARAKVEAEAKAKAEADAKVKEEAEAAKAKAKEDAEKAAAAAAAVTAAPKSDPTLKDLEAKGFDNLSPAEQDKYFDLLEQEDAKREAEQAKITEQKKIEAAKAKVISDAAAAKNAANEDKNLREQEAEAERLEVEKESKRKEREAKGEQMDMATALKAKIAGISTPEAPVAAMANKMASLSLGKNALGSKAGSQKQKPAALILEPLKTSVIEAPQPSAALQSLKSARFLQVMTQDIYPEGIKSPNPAVSTAARGKNVPFSYDMNFMLQFQGACKEAPSIDFQHQVKTLIGEEGGSRSVTTKTPSGTSRQNSRAPGGGGGGFSAMGSFVNTAGSTGPGGRTLQPNTTSDYRFAMANNAIAGGGRPSGANPMGSFRGGSSMSRNPSSGGGLVPNSPRTGSRRGGGSKRNDPHMGKNEAKANASMPLTQGMDLRPIATSSSGWKAASIANKSHVVVATETGLMDPAMVQRKVKAALNKMTPEKFDRLADQILAIATQSKHESDGRTLRQVIQLVFEKATDEAHWSGMYAKFCRKMLDTMGEDIRDEGILDKKGSVVSGGALFRKYLLNRCQEEFERGWQVDIPKPEDGKSKEAQLLSDEYYIAAAAKRRGLGLVQFIGELFKLDMLTERIMHECVRKLLDFEGEPDEAEIESLSKLLRTIGATLDSSEKGNNMMNAYFKRIQVLVGLDLASRMKFMLMDVIDLRRTGWSGDENKGPKTLEEIRAAAEAALLQKQAEAARHHNQRGGRPQGGRGDPRNFSSNYGQSASNHVPMDDLKRLKGSANRNQTHSMTLGPASMMQSRSNSGRRMGPGGFLSRGTDDSSRTGTPLQRPSTNAFALLAAHHADDPTSPPSTAASPNIKKAIPAASDEKKSG